MFTLNHAMLLTYPPKQCSCRSKVAPARTLRHKCEGNESTFLYMFALSLQYPMCAVRCYSQQSSNYYYSFLLLFHLFIHEKQDCLLKSSLDVLITYILLTGSCLTPVVPILRSRASPYSLCMVLEAEFNSGCDVVYNVYRSRRGRRGRRRGRRESCV